MDVLLTAQLINSGDIELEYLIISRLREFDNAFSREVGYRGQGPVGRTTMDLAHEAVCIEMERRKGRTV